MPTKRFNNLSEDKRKRIFEAIVYEFSGNSIEKTDIAAIVKRAGIPRGSFYQYFEDKDDAVLYAVERIKEEKIAYCKDALLEAGGKPFIDYLAAVFNKAMEFAGLNPEFLSIGAQLVTLKNRRLQEYVGKTMESLYEHYVSRVEKDQREGVIRKDIDAKSIVHMIFSLTSDSALERVYEQRGDIEGIRKVFEDMFEVLRHGLRPR